MKLGNRYRFLRKIYPKKMREHKLDELQYLMNSKEILDGNYLELIDHINRYEEDKSLQYWRNRPKHQQFLQELLRLLHNYLASAFSSRDHSFEFSKEISPNFKSDCYSEWNKMMHDTEFLFIQELRTFIQHNRVPDPIALVKYENAPNRESENKSLNLSVNALLQWSPRNKDRSRDWKKLVIPFLKAKGAYCELKPLIKNHYRKMEKYLLWIRNEIRELKSEAISELSNMRTEIYSIEMNLQGKVEFEIEEL